MLLQINPPFCFFSFSFPLFSTHQAKDIFFAGVLIPAKDDGFPFVLPFRTGGVSEKATRIPLVRWLPIRAGSWAPFRGHACRSAGSITAPGFFSVAFLGSFCEISLHLTVDDEALE